MAQASLVLMLGVAGAVACGSSSPIVAPSDPEATIRGFMAAVEQKSLSAMGQLWGTEDGLASDRFDRAEMEQRLTVMQMYLEHDAYTVSPGRMADVGLEERQFQVQLSRRGCRAVVPFTMVMVGQAWLVKSIDLTQAGNPARVCAP